MRPTKCDDDRGCFRSDCARSAASRGHLAPVGDNCRRIETLDLFAELQIWNVRSCTASLISKRPAVALRHLPGLDLGQHLLDGNRRLLGH